MLNKKLVIWGVVVLLLIAGICIFCYERDRNDLGRNIRSLESSNSKVREKAVKNLARIGKPAVEPLIYALKYGAVHLKSDTLNSMTTVIKDKRFRNMAMTTMSESKNLKTGAMKTLGEIGDSRAIAPLIEQLRNPDKDLAAGASDALVKIGKPAVEPLIKNFDVNNDGFAITLGKIGDERAVDVLIKSLVIYPTEKKIDTDAESEALVKIGMPAARKLIEVIRKNQKNLPPWVAIHPLSLMDNTDVQNLLITNLLEDYDPHLLSALENMKSPQALASLLQMLDCPDDGVAEKVEFMLHNLHSERALGNLVKIRATMRYNWEHDTMRCLGYRFHIDYAISREIDRLLFIDDASNLFDALNYNYSVFKEILSSGEPMEKVDLLNLISGENLPDCCHYNEASLKSYRRDFLFLMKDKDPSVRKAAAVSFNSSGEEYISNLTDNLKDDDQEIRLLSARIFVDRGGYELLQSKLNDLANREPEDHAYKEIVFRCRKNPGETEKLASVLDEKGSNRLMQVQLLGFIGGQRAVEALIGALKDKDPVVVEAAAHSLAYTGDLRAVLPLCDVLKTGDKAAKCEIICALGFLHDNRSVNPLLEILKGDDEECKILAVRALGIIGDKRAVLPLCESMYGMRLKVMALTAEILGDLGDKRAVPHLMDIATVSYKNIGVQAIRSLGKLKDKRAAAVLNESLMSRSYPIRKESIKALRNAWDKNSVKLLGKLLTDSKYYDNETVMVCEALSAIKDPTVVDIFLKALKHKDEKISRIAVVALGTHKEKRVVKALLKLLKPGGDNVDEIVVSLGKLKDPEAVVPLIEMFDGGQEIDGEIITALAGMGEPSVKELKKALRNKNRLVQDGARRTLDRMGIMRD